MPPFHFGMTTISVNPPLTRIETAACCGPVGASYVRISTFPPNLVALRRQLRLLEAAGFEKVGYTPLDRDEARRARGLLSRLAPRKR